MLHCSRHLCFNGPEVGYEVMIDTCSNRECNEKLVYLRSGVLYEMEQRTNEDIRKIVHYYWLCKSCSDKFDLQFNERGEASLVQRTSATLHRAPETACRNTHVQRIFINQHPPELLRSTADFAGEPDASVQMNGMTAMDGKRKPNSKTTPGKTKASIEDDLCCTKFSARNNLSRTCSIHLL